MIDLPGGGINSLFSSTGASVETVKVNWWMVGSPELFAVMPETETEPIQAPDDTPAEPADDPVPEPAPETDPEVEPKP